MTLKIENTVSKMVYNFDNLEDKLTSNLFYTFDIQLESKIEEGSYTYTLYENDVVKATGVLQCGNYKPNNKTYSAKTENGYIQYQS